MKFFRKSLVVSNLLLVVSPFVSFAEKAPEMAMLPAPDQTMTLPLRAHEHPIRQSIVDQTGSLLFTSESYAIHIWKLDTKDLRKPLATLETSDIDSNKYSMDRKKIAIPGMTAGFQGSLYNIPRRKRILFEQGTHFIEFSQDGSVYVLESKNGQDIQIHDSSTGRMLKKFRAGHFELSPNGTFIWVENSTVHGLYNILTGKKLSMDLSDYRASIGFSKDSKYFIYAVSSSGQEGRVAVYDIQQNKQVAQWSNFRWPAEYPQLNFTISPDGQQVLVVTETEEAQLQGTNYIRYKTNQAAIYELLTGKLISPLWSKKVRYKTEGGGCDLGLVTTAWSNDSQQLAIVTRFPEDSPTNSKDVQNTCDLIQSNNVFVWNRKTKEVSSIASIEPPVHPRLSSVETQFSPDGTFLAILHGSKEAYEPEMDRLMIYHLPTHKKLTLQGEQVRSFSVTDDFRHILATEVSGLLNCTDGESLTGKQLDEAKEVCRRLTVKKWKTTSLFAP